MALVIGAASSFITIVGWAKQFSANARLRTARIVFVAPWVAALIGYPIEGFNVHGPSALLFFLVMPIASVLALVPLIMSER